jgi:hypothetical protein
MSSSGKLFMVYEGFGAGKHMRSTMFQLLKKDVGFAHIHPQRGADSHGRGQHMDWSRKPRTTARKSTIILD